jgi:hypothetical protein
MRSVIPLPPLASLGRRQRLSQEGVEQAAAGGGGGEARLEPVAQRHQRIDLSDNAVLLGEGVEGERKASGCFRGSNPAYQPHKRARQVPLIHPRPP